MPKQWITVILVNVVISAVTTLLIVRVLTNQPGARPSITPASTEQVAAPVAVQNPSPTPLPSPTSAPVTVPPLAKPTPTPTTPLPTNTPPPQQAPSPTPAPRSTGTVGISAVLNAGQKQREVVVIVNQGNEVSLKGWILTSSRGVSYTFNNVTLFKDSFISLHSTTGADVPTDLFMNRSDAAWQVGDLLTISNQGQTIATITVRQQ